MNAKKLYYKIFVIFSLMICSLMLAQSALATDTAASIDDILAAAPHKIPNFFVHAKTGNDFIELPVGDAIGDAYKKGNDLAFIVTHTDGRTAGYSYVIEWHGHLLWSGKPYDPKHLPEKYLESVGWEELPTVPNDTKLILSPEKSIEILTRGPDREFEFADACLDLFDWSIVSSETNKKLAYVRLMRQPVDQDIAVYCNSAAKEGSSDYQTLSKVASRLEQPEVISGGYIWKLTPDKILLASGSVAVMIRPDLSFYGDKPDDFYPLPAHKAYDIEHDVLLAFDQNFVNDQRAATMKFSEFQDYPERLKPAQAMLAKRLDKFLQETKDQK